MSGTISCFRLGPLKSGMYCKVKSNVKMTRCRLQGGDGEVGTGEQGELLGQGEAALVDEAKGEGKAAGAEEAGPGRSFHVGRGCRWQIKDGEVE